MDNRTSRASRITWIGLLVNIILTLFKFAAGILGRSAAMIADGFHSFSDFATDIVVLLGFRIVEKPVDKTHDYGHGKAETLASVVIGIALFIVGFIILWEGVCCIFRVYQGQLIPEPGWIAFYAGILSMVIKEMLYRYTVKVGKTINSQAVIANAWHHRSDVFSSVGTVSGIGGAIALGERWHILDPVAAVMVSFFIMKTAVNISLVGLHELMEKSLSDETENKILDIIRVIPGAERPHNLKTRMIGNYIAVDVHVRVDKNMNVAEAHDISVNVENKIKKSFGDNSIISVHIEPLK